MKTKLLPVNNSNSHPAVALREAAIAFARHLSAPMGPGERDTEGERLNLALLRAARAYARQANPRGE